MAIDDGLQARWELAYAAGHPPWDIGRPQPAFERLLEAGRLVGPALDSGCGTGEHALLLAARGIEAIGVDVSPTAIRTARLKARERALAATFVVGDVLDLEPVGRGFRSVIDSGMFHTLDDDARRRYVAELAASVEPGGRVFLLCFSERTPGQGGPRRVTREEIRAAFRAGWTVEAIDAERFEVRPGSMAERPYAWLATIVRAAARP